MARAKSPAAAPKATRKTPSKKKSADTLVAYSNPYSDIGTKASATFTLFRDDYLSSQGLWDDTQEPYDKLLKKFGKSTTWVNIAVSRVATAAAQIPIQVIYKDREGQPNALVRGYDRGLRQLMETPNPFQSWMEFMETCSVSLNLTGNLFIEVVGDVKPEELYVLNPGRVTIVGDPKDFIKGYIYSVNGKSINFPRASVIHVKLPHPYNDYYGLSPATSARMAIETDISSQEWNQNFMLKGGWPGGAIETPDSLDIDSQKRLKKEIKNSLSKGKETAGKILLLTNGLKYNPISIKPKDSDWLDARRMSRDEILAIWGVPYAVACLFSTEQTTARSAGVEQQIKQFYRGTVCSHLKRILDALNRELVPRYSPTYKLIPDLRAVPALADDVDTELKRSQAAHQLIAAGFPLNQVMAYFYPIMAPVAWGDCTLANQATVAITGPFNPVLQEPSGAPLAGGISGPSDGTVGKPKPGAGKPPVDPNAPTDPNAPKKPTPPKKRVEVLSEALSLLAHSTKPLTTELENKLDES